MKKNNTNSFIKFCRNMHALLDFMRSTFYQNLFLVLSLLERTKSKKSQDTLIQGGFYTVVVLLQEQISTSSWAERVQMDRLTLLQAWVLTHRAAASILGGTNNSNPTSEATHSHPFSERSQLSGLSHFPNLSQECFPVLKDSWDIELGLTWSYNIISLLTGLNTLTSSFCLMI